MPDPFGKYAKREHERRWLLPALPGGLDPAQPWARLTDHYLEGTRFRVRERVALQSGDVVWKLTHKFPERDGSNDRVVITNNYLTREEYDRFCRLPGRLLVGSSCALVSRIVDIKDGPSSRHFAVVDASMTELIRPALYGAFHRIEAVAPGCGRDLSYDVVGPVCESSDAFGEERRFPALEVGDLLAILDAGAYGSAMGSTYNRRPLAAEVLIDGGTATVIRRRQTFDEMLMLEL